MSRQTASNSSLCSRRSLRLKRYSKALRDPSKILMIIDSCFLAVFWQFGLSRQTLPACGLGHSDPECPGMLVAKSQRDKYEFSVHYLSCVYER